MTASTKAPTLAERVAKGRVWLADLRAAGDTAEYDRLYPRWDALRRQHLAELEGKADRLDAELIIRRRVGDDVGWDETFAAYEAVLDRWQEEIDADQAA